MPVSVWFVRVPEGLEDNVKKSICQIQFAEVTETGKGCLVLATDTENPEIDLEVIERIKGLKNVLDVSLVMTADENAAEEA